MIVGGGPAKESLESLSVELGISDKVIFTGMIPPTEVHEYYQLGDIFVSASTSETQGLTYIEASANGLPLLCREDPCHEEILKVGENGYTYTNEEEFLTGLDALSFDPEKRAKAGKRSEELSAIFDKSVFGDAVEEIFIEAVKKNQEIKNKM